MNSTSERTLLENLEYDYINSLLKGNFRAADKWVINFFEHYNKNFFKYQSIRHNLIIDINNNPCLISTHIDFYKIMNLSNILVNLNTNPDWIDIILTARILNIDFVIKDEKKFGLMVYISKLSIIEKLRDG